jgi:hypothetical protein
VSAEFRLRSVAAAAFGPATPFGLAEGAMIPVIALSLRVEPGPFDNVAGKQARASVPRTPRVAVHAVVRTGNNADLGDTLSAIVSDGRRVQ